MSPGDNSLSGRQPKAVQSALQVLEQVARAGPGVTAKEIAAALSMPPATAYRILNLLVGEDYLVRLPDLSGFALGRKIGVFVDAVVVPVVSTAAREVLSELRSTVRFGVHLSYYTHAGIKMADADPEYPPPEDEGFVNRHLWTCALGKLLLADAGPRGTALPPAALERLGPATVALRSDLTRQLDDVRTLGYALQVGELSAQSACLAVPVRNPAGDIVAGLALSGRVDQREALQRQLETLRECAGRLAPLLA